MGVNHFGMRHKINVVVLRSGDGPRPRWSFVFSYYFPSGCIIAFSILRGLNLSLNFVPHLTRLIYGVLETP